MTHRRDRLNVRITVWHIVSMGLLCWLSLMSQSVIAQSTVVDSTAICRQKTDPLPQGEVIGELTQTSTAVYMGPSVVCSAFARLKKTDPFVVIGQKKSTFGKPWYIVKGTGNNKLQGWVPAKYIRLGKRPVPPPKYTTEAIDNTPIVPTVELNVRDCPSARCQRLGSLTNGQRYVATKQSSNDWYFVRINASTSGWVSGRYVRLVEEQDPEAEEKTESVDKSNHTTIDADTKRPAEPNLDVEQPAQSDVTDVLVDDSLIESNSASDSETTLISDVVETIDHCKMDRIRVTAYRQLGLWEVEKPFSVSTAPHDLCQKMTELTKGKAVISLGEVEGYYQLAYIQNEHLEYGYLKQDAFADQYVYVQELPRNLETYHYYQWLNEAEIYWQTLEYKLKRTWKKVKQFAANNPEKTILLIAVVLGTLLVIPRRTRHALYKVDQALLRTGYFMLRSPRFWRFLRLMVFWFALVAVGMFLLYLYGNWLVYVASYADKFVGGSIFALFMISLGWFGVRVLCFLMAIILTLFSFSKFVLLMMLTVLVFLLPSWLLMGVAFIRYIFLKRQMKPQTPPSDDEEQVEAIHAKFFRFRNIYPETIINWIRHDRWPSIKAQAEKLIRARSGIFNAFFSFMGTDT